MGFLTPWKQTNLINVWTWPHYFWFNLLGLWAEDIASPTRRQVLTVWRNLNLGNYIYFVFGIYMAVIKKVAAGHVVENMFVIFTIGPASVGTYKLFQIVKHREPLKRIMDNINDLTGDISQLDENETNFRRVLDRTWLIFFACLSASIFSILHWCLRPTVIFLIYGERTLIIDTWPVFIETSTQYSITYALQFLSVLGIGHGFLIFDNLFFCIAHLLLSHISIFKNHIENFQFKDDSESKKEMKAIIDRHNKILRITNDLKYSSEGVLIAQVMCTAISLCSGVFILTMTEEVSMNHILNLGEVELLMTANLYCFCWYSNEIIIQCESLRSSAYMSNWINGSVGQKKDLLILMTRTMRPIIFGGCFKISLNTLISVFQATFSYYNFLQAAIGTYK